MRAAKDIVKVGGFTAPHDFSYTTRANIAHEEVEQIRARIVCTPAEKEWRGRGFNMCADGMESVFFIFDVCYTPTLSCRGRATPVSATPTSPPTQNHTKIKNFSKNLDMFTIVW